jgi:broad specificity phosphatase PhoE
MRLESLTLTRHGESTANLAVIDAYRRGAQEWAVAERDPDVPLSARGEAQAAALGAWLAGLPEQERPTLVMASPFLRTRRTAEIALAAVGSPPVRFDERLRDRETGTLSGLTGRGIKARFPDEWARKELLGKFYYRPPGGEAWTDVALRLRSILGDLDRDHPGERVLLVVHDAIVVLVRYILEELSEQELLEIEKDVVRNCSVTRWRFKGGIPQLIAYNDTSHLAAVDAGFGEIA